MLVHDIHTPKGLKYPNKGIWGFCIRNDNCGGDTPTVRGIGMYI